jgi:undecaprenyl-diphosphatase
VAPREWLLLTLVLAALLPARALLLEAGGYDLHFEEAQYWAWSRHLDWGYYSKGPLVAWLIAAGDALPGQGEWQVRLPAWLAYDLFLLLVFLFARDLWRDRRAAWWALALGIAMPAYFVLGGVMTTDVLLFAAWAGGLWAAWRALAQGDTRAWYAFAVAVGLGALAKPSIGLLPAFTGLAMLAHGPWRRQLATPHPWLAGLLALALMAPMLAWNAAHGWVMLRHNQGHVTGGGAGGNPGELLAAQVLLVSPVVALWMLAALWRPPAAPGARLLWLVSLGVLAFFLARAFAGKVQPNWPAPVYIGLLVLLAGRAPRAPGWLPPLAALTGLGLALAVLLPGILGVPGERHPFRELQAWEGPVARLAAQAPRADFVLTRHYGTAATLSYYWPGGIQAYLGPAGGRRHNQYDLWPGPQTRQGEDGLYVGVDRAQLPEAVAAGFRGGCTPRPPVPARTADGGVLRTLHSWLCRDLGPVRWSPAERY